MYEGDEHETFEAELEKALEARVNYIIIEPQRLGDETARWITVGNCLHKTAVLSGLASIVCGSLWPERPVFSSPLCAISIFCTGLYTVSWNVDHCCQYQVIYFVSHAHWYIVNPLLFYFVLFTGGKRSEEIRKNSKLP